MTPDILYVPLPKPRLVESPRLYLFLGSLLIGWFVILGVMVTVGVTLPNAAVVGLVVLVVILLLTILVAVVVTEVRRLRQRRRGTEMCVSDDLSAAARKLLVSLGVGRRRMIFRLPWAKYDRERIQRGIPPLTVVVDEALREPVERVGQTDHLLEPERLVPCRPGKLSLSLAVGTFLLMILCLVRGNVVVATLCAGGLLQYAWTVPGLSTLVPFLGDHIWPLAGPGYVEIAGNRLLTADDSVMVVSRAPIGRSVRVFLAGPAGSLGNDFPRAESPEFARLWQRWTHPHPRLDLANEPADAALGQP